VNAGGDKHDCCADSDGLWFRGFSPEISAEVQHAYQAFSKGVETGVHTQPAPITVIQTKTEYKIDFGVTGTIPAPITVVNPAQSSKSEPAFIFACKNLQDGSCQCIQRRDVRWKYANDQPGNVTDSSFLSSSNEEHVEQGFQQWRSGGKNSVQYRSCGRNYTLLFGDDKHEQTASTGTTRLAFRVLMPVPKLQSCTWTCDVDGRIEQYDAKTSAIIEAAFQNQSPKVSIKTKHGAYDIVFHPTGHKQVNTSTGMKRPVCRHTKQMPSTLCTLLQNFRTKWQTKGDPACRKSVPKGSDEFTNVQVLMNKSLPKQIINIERVENVLQWNAFKSEYCRIQTDCGSDWDAKMLLQLWHGTDVAALDSITSGMDGFLPLLTGSKVGARYGAGTYFARDASYSNQGNICLQ